MLLTTCLVSRVRLRATQGAAGLWPVQVSRSPRVGTELRDHRAFLWSENMCESVQ